jgi:hypothetical protein
MIRFLESGVGQLIARSGILAIILAWALYQNNSLTERLFVIIENNTATMNAVKKACGDYNGR